jgi:hypothetical protein
MFGEYRKDRAFTQTIFWNTNIGGLSSFNGEQALKVCIEILYIS